MTDKASLSFGFAVKKIIKKQIRSFLEVSLPVRA